MTKLSIEYVLLIIAQLELRDSSRKYAATASYIFYTAGDRAKKSRKIASGNIKKL